MRELTRLIREDMKPALGVTEPGAIAFAVASAKAYVEGRVERVEVALNSGMYKNAFTCGIPNSDAFGNQYAAALGAVAADASLGLESLSHITEADNAAARRMVEDGEVTVKLDHMGSEIAIDATVRTKQDCCTVHIRGGHTQICWVEKNGCTIFGEPVGTPVEGEAKDREEIAAIHGYSLQELIDYVWTVSAEEIAFIRDAFVMNLELLEEGLTSDRTSIGPMLLRENGNVWISENVKQTAQLLCNGAIEARVLGLAKPAMSITGSGAHGIIATMPLMAWQQVCMGETGEEMLLRAAALSCLVTMYIKEYSGKLSAFCGCGIAAGTGMACGLGFLRGADLAQETMILQNMASGLTGMICDGGNPGCAMKGMVAVDAAFRAVDLAMNGICIDAAHGINGRTPEDTMRNMGRIASPGMVETEKTIVEIMERK